MESISTTNQIAQAIMDRFMSFNNRQKETGSVLKTLKGSDIKRSKFGVGKVVGSKIYFHKMYTILFINNPVFHELYEKATKGVSFNYNIVRFDKDKREVALEECPNFNTEREPVIGRVAVFNLYDKHPVVRKYNSILHHKWTMVDNSYSGFDVRESWEWSKKWLSTLTEPALGYSTEAWIEQLERFNLL